MLAGWLFWSKAIQRAYDKRHEGQPSKVQLNDAIFALHAAFISFFTLAQVMLEHCDTRALCLAVCVIYRRLTRRFTMVSADPIVVP